MTSSLAFHTSDINILHSEVLQNWVFVDVSWRILQSVNRDFVLVTKNWVGLMILAQWDSSITTWDRGRFLGSFQPKPWDSVIKGNTDNTKLQNIP